MRSETGAAEGSGVNYRLGQYPPYPVKRAQNDDPRRPSHRPIAPSPRTATRASLVRLGSTPHPSHLAPPLYTTMRLTALTIPLLAIAPCISASLAGEAFEWANSLVSSDPAAKKAAAQGGEVHTMDSWSYVDCGLASDVV